MFGLFFPNANFASEHSFACSRLNGKYKKMTRQQDYPFSDKELQTFRELIDERLDRLRAQADNLKAQREDLIDDGFQDQASYGDESQIDQELMKLDGLLENDLEQIRGLEAALLRIENKTYGICTETGEFIKKERLMALPEATTCL